MIRYLAPICLAALLLPQDAEAQQRERIGYGRLITNDYIVDGQDRWRTGSVQSSRLWGRGWTGVLPTQPGEILELRFGAEIIAPDDLDTPALGDRPFATALTAGLHTHFDRKGIEIALGADLVMTGPQTRLDKLQEAFHDLVGVEKASDATRAAQVGNAIYPTLVAEAGREFDLSANARMRPFLEARAGVETLVRAGVDVTFGEVGRGELMVRDGVTGQRYRTIGADFSGFAFVMGGDIASVSDSQYLPASSGVEVRDMRTRLRAGLHWQGDQMAAFYGVTWLGKEFEGQDEGQFLGSIRLDLNF
jgi:hypothetical protein